MDRQTSYILFDILRDTLIHHRKFTAFQKTVALSAFLAVLVLIFKNLWIVILVVSYCICLYLSYLACQKIVEYRTFFPSDLILVYVEHVENFIENCHQIFQLESNNPKANDVALTAMQQDEESTDNDVFFDAPDDFNSDTMSQSTFYLELGCGSSEHGTQNVETSRFKYSDFLDKNCPPNVQDEIEKLIILIEKDFIKSWYYLFSKHFESLNDAHDLLHVIVVNILQRLLKVDIKVMAKVLMCMFSNHVKSCKEARMMYKITSKKRSQSSSRPENMNLPPKLPPTTLKSLEECFASKVDFHTALKNSDIEYLYLNSLVELLILKLVPNHLNDTKAVVCALREILSCNILSSVMNLICDPTFLHERIIKITSDENPEGDLIDSPILTKTSDNSEEETTQLEQERSDVVAIIQETPVSEVKEVGSETQNKERRKSSFLNDTELHFVSRVMCNECNRLCSKDRDKIEPHPHTCSLDKEPCFLDVKCHDKERLSTSSGDSSPVFKLFISDINSGEENPSMFVHHSISHDIPNDTNETDKTDIIPDKLLLDNKPLKSEEKDTSYISDLSKSWPGEAGKSSLTDSTKSEPIGQSVQDEKLPQDSNTNRSQDTIPLYSKGADGTEPVQGSQYPDVFKETQEPRFFQSFGGGFFNFTFPQFGSKPLKEKNRSSTNLAHLSDTESDDFANLRRSKSSTEFRPDDIVAGHEAPLCSTEAPLPFQDVHIEKTETAREAGSLNPYTLYVIEYEAIHPTDEGIFVHRSGKVKRRFREFINLQLRLEDNPSYKKSLKDIKGPKKWLQLPFGNMDKDSIESRRKILYTFLSALIKKEDICQGAELKEFLGYSGDGHIAFVRKVPENIGPRIDQRLVKTMSGVFDKIVDALPSLPNELPRIMKTERSRDESEPDKLVDDCDQIDLETVFDEDPKRSHRLHKTLEDFVRCECVSLQLSDHEDGDQNTTLGTSVLDWQEGYSQYGTADRNQSTEVQTETQTENHTQCCSKKFRAKGCYHVLARAHMPSKDVKICDEDPVPLSNALLDILSELLTGCDSWMCREMVMKSLKTVAGKALERYLSKKIEYLVSGEMNTFYLRTLRETVWPDDQLSTESRPNYTDRQKEAIKKQAARCLGDFLPGALHTLLGRDDFELTIDEIMESIKCEKLNRHFWYTFLDILVEHLFPEIMTEEIQRKLSRS